MKRLVVSWRRMCALVLLVLLSAGQVVSGKDETATVVSVKDGDTFVAIVAGRTETIRLIGIDAPESWYNDKAKRDADETGEDVREIVKRGRASTAYMRGVLKKGTIVRLEYDVRKGDRYSRLLYYVYLPDGSMLNEKLVRNGYAEAKRYPPNVRHHARLVKAEGKVKD